MVVGGMLESCFNRLFQLSYNWVRTSIIFKRSRSQMFCKIGILRNFAKLKWKHLRSVTWLKRLQRRCFPGNFGKFLRTPFYWLLWTTDSRFFLFLFLFFFLLPNKLILTRFFKFWTCFIMSFKRDEYHEFCNWKTILYKTNKGALKHLLKLTEKHLYRSLFLMKIHNRELQIY